MIYKHTMKLSRKHQDLLKAIRKNPNATLRELQDVIDANATSVVDYHLTKLMAKGLLRKGDKWTVVEQPD